MTDELLTSPPSEFYYTDLDAFKAALIGRSIVSARKVTQNEAEDDDWLRGRGYDGQVELLLDDGSTLIAKEHDGGCACSNGCFSVDSPILQPPEEIGGAPVYISGTILNVELEEWENGYNGEGYSPKKRIEPASDMMTDVTIRLFVYTDLKPNEPQKLLESEGSDNGFYGWGFWLAVKPSPSAPPVAERSELEA